MLHREKGELPTSRLEGLAHCGLVPGKHPVRLDATDWCVNGRCTLVMLVGLSHGETLRLDWVAPASEVDAELRLAPVDYLGVTGVLADWFGDEVAKGALSPGERAALRRGALSCSNAAGLESTGAPVVGLRTRRVAAPRFVRQ